MSIVIARRIAVFEFIIGDPSFIRVPNVQHTTGSRIAKATPALLLIFFVTILQT